MLTSFSTDLVFSLTYTDEDLHRLYQLFPDASSITKTDVATDKAGADYVATYYDGQQETIDVKRRREGCERYWASPNIPELALELVSDVDRNLPGWAVVDSAIPDWFCFIFPSRTILLDAHDLREVVRVHQDEWRARYGVRTTASECDGRIWVSEWVPVPLPVVQAALDELRPDAFSSLSYPKHAGTLPRGVQDF